MDSQFCATLSRLHGDLGDLIKNKSTGTLYVSNGEDVVAKIYLLSGHFLYVVDAHQRMRRWRRATFQHANSWQQPTEFNHRHPWEYDFLYQGISGGKLSLEHAKSIITTVAEECWLGLALFPNLKTNWIHCQRMRSTYSFFLSLSEEELTPTFIHSNEQYEEWQKAFGGGVSPDLFPTLTDKGQQLDNPKVKAYLTGTSSVWDIALQLKQPVAKVQKSLVAWQSKDLLLFKSLKDLPPPVEEGEEKIEIETAPPPPVVTKAPEVPAVKEVKKAEVAQKAEIPQKAPPAAAKTTLNGKGSLIACIDDSPIIIHNLRSILEPAGFSVLAINEPMAGFGELIQHKPRLILLDINMPNADGYTVCKFLHETEAFKGTPIIILTAHDGVVDRTKAKLAGANDFLSKPPDPEELLAKIQKYLSLRVTP